MNLLTKPTKADLEEIRAWLLQEKQDIGESFIFNWNIIEEGFTEGRFASAKMHHQTVVFLVWSEPGRTAEILVMAVRPDMRGQGVGTRFVEKVFPYLTDKLDVLVLEAQCAPISSEPFWRKHGFIDYPPNHPTARRSGIHLYRPMIEPLSTNPIQPPFAFLELWHRQPFEVTPDLQADSKFYLALDPSGACSQTVAIPAANDWQVRLTCPGRQVRKEKVKHLFSPACREGGFLVGIPVLTSEALKGMP